MTARRSWYAQRVERRGLQLVEGRPIGLVLGSGLNSLAEAVEGAVAVPYEEIPYFPASTAPGHAGRLVVGRLAGQTVVAMQGRVHFYEGYTAEEITFPIRVMKRLGVGKLILTNAAGGVNPGFRAGDLMLIVDHLNFVGMAGQNPLIGPERLCVRHAFSLADANVRAVSAQGGAGVGAATGDHAAPGRVRLSRRSKL